MLDFIREYVKDPRRVGAVAPSSRYLALKMIENINFEDSEAIVEYGPGTGVFTEKIVKNLNESTLFFIVETNNEFYVKLKDKYSNMKNVIVINDSAENIKSHLFKHNISKVDYIISGLPFTSLPQKVSNNILNITKDILSTSGQFITFQYSLMKKSMFLRYFTNLDFKKVYLNFPPAYVLRFTN